MSTAKSAWYDLGGGTGDPFNLTRVSIKDGMETAETLGRFLLHGLTDTNHLASIIAQHGYPRLVEYIQERRVPTKLNIRVADFGEIVSGHLLEEEENLIRPLEKLRYVFNHDWSPHLTDVFSVLIEDDEITAFAYCEVKSGTTSPNTDVGAKGYRDLIEVQREKMPEILYFTSERLHEAQRFDEWDRLDRAMYAETPVPQLLRLTLVFDETAWSEAVLDAVAIEVERNPLPDNSFVCYLVTKNNLRALVNDSFEKMEEYAVNL